MNESLDFCPTTLDNHFMVPRAQSVDQIVSKMNQRSPQPQGRILPVELPEGLSPHNPSLPIKFGGEMVMAIRGEKPGEVAKSKTFLCHPESDGVFRPIKGSKVFDMFEDPSFAFIDGGWVLTGVWVTNTNPLEFHQPFLRMHEVDEFEEIGQGPPQMKNIEIGQESKTGEVHTVGRPQEQLYRGKLLYRGAGRGTLSYVKLPSSDYLCPKIIGQAPMIRGIFQRRGWGGGTNIHILGDGMVGIDVHAADEIRKPSYNRRYIGGATVLDTEILRFTDIVGVATRDHFPEGPAKTGALRYVVFGAVDRRENNRAAYYCGTSDAQVGVIDDMPDPYVDLLRDAWGYRLCVKEGVPLQEVA